MRLPHSPPGQSGHPHLTQAALQIYGKRSWSDLSADQMKSICEFMAEHNKIPTKQDLGK
jgi:hypothetical protein